MCYRQKQNDEPTCSEHVSHGGGKTRGNYAQYKTNEKTRNVAVEASTSRSASQRRGVTGGIPSCQKYASLRRSHCPLPSGQPSTGSNVIVGSVIDWRGTLGGVTVDDVTIGNMTVRGVTVGGVTVDDATVGDVTVGGNNRAADGGGEGFAIQKRPRTGAAIFSRVSILTVFWGILWG